MQDAHNRIWLDSLFVPLANLTTFDQCVCLCSGNGSTDLLVVDLGRTPPPYETPPVVSRGRVDPYNQGKSYWWNFESRIKVFQGNKIIKEMVVASPPTAILSLYSAIQQQKQQHQHESGGKEGVADGPDLVLASGAALYMYRGYRPVARYTIPGQPVDTVEREVWERMLGVEAERSSRIEVEQGQKGAQDQEGAGMDEKVVEEAVKLLKGMRDDGVVDLTARSLRLLALGRNSGDESAEGVTAEQVDFTRAMALTKLVVEVSTFGKI